MKNKQLRTKIRFVAIAFIILYAIVRFFLVKAVLQGYGVNPWLFLLLDASTGVVYVVGIEQLIIGIKAARDAYLRWPKLIAWALITAASFAIPYVYLYMSSHELPGALGIGIGVIIALLLVNALVSFYRRLRRNAKG